MVSVWPATVAGPVRTVAAAAPGPAEGALAAGGGLLAGEPLAEAAVIPPAVATAARPMPAMMILGCRMISSW